MTGHLDAGIEGAFAEPPHGGCDEVRVPLIPQRLPQTLSPLRDGQAALINSFGSFSTCESPLIPVEVPLGLPTTSAHFDLGGLV